MKTLIVEPSIAQNVATFSADPINFFAMVTLAAIGITAMICKAV